MLDDTVFETVVRKHHEPAFALEHVDGLFEQLFEAGELLVDLEVGLDGVDQSDLSDPDIVWRCRPLDRADPFSDGSLRFSAGGAV